MSTHIVIHSIPFTTRLAHPGARHILARDRARAQKILAGLNPHGPLVFYEARRARRHPGGHATTPHPTQPSKYGTSSDSVNVTDAGMCAVCLQ